MSKSNLYFNIQTTNTGQILHCLRQKVDKTRYLVELQFNVKSTQSVWDKLKRIIVHDLKYKKQDKT